MKGINVVWLALLVCWTDVSSQEIPQSMEQQLENMTEQQTLIDNDDQLQQMAGFRQAPLDLNRASRNELLQLGLLSALQIDNLLSYRNLLGSIVDVHELQAIPSWGIDIIRLLLPFITIKQGFVEENAIAKRFCSGNHQILLRLSQDFGNDTSLTKNSRGSAQQLFFRYRYSYKNLLQYGIAGEKDAGESFFKGAQRRGFDFYSGHFFLREMGLVKAVALGDFTVSMAQGLVHWQGPSFGKSAEAMNIKRQAAVLRPYNSTNEFNFQRGAGITVGKRRWQATAFLSFKKVDAVVIRDSLLKPVSFSSFQTSGYHRTVSEQANKNQLRQWVAGGVLGYNTGRFQFEINAIMHRFSIPLKKNEQPYSLFAIEGNDWTNASAAYSYTYRNIHFFGELAVDKFFSHASINGVQASVDSKVDISFLYRYLSKKYQAINASAFGESGVPSNENGTYIGVVIRPSQSWKLDLYADIYSFPWLKYRVDAPSAGKDFSVQLFFTPDRKTVLYSRYRYKTKLQNMSNVVASIPAVQFKQNWRIHMENKLNSTLTIRNRIEMSWFHQEGKIGERIPQKGFLTYVDVIYKPMMKKLSWILRMQYFDADNYDSSIYAYENDVLFSYSIPAFFNKGYRFYVLSSLDLTQYFSFALKFSQTINAGVTDSEYARHEGKLTLKLQLLYKL